MAPTPTRYSTTDTPPRTAGTNRTIDPATIEAEERAPRKRFRPWFVATGALAVTAAILILGAPGPWPTPQAAQQGVIVGPGGGNSFGPAALTITAGDTVAWNWESGKHTVTSAGSEPFDSGTLTAPATFSHTFTTAGTYSYLCIYHAGMTGTITVLAAPAAAPAPGAPATPGSTPAKPGTAGATGSASQTGGPTDSATSAGGTTQTAAAADSPAVSKPGAPKLTSVRVTGRQLRISVNETATVDALAFRAGSPKSVRIASVKVAPGASKLDLRLDRLTPARYRLVVRAKDTTGVRSRPTRLGYLLTNTTWKRAIAARRAQQKVAPAAPAAPATVASSAAAAVPGLAPAVTDTTPAPAASAPSTPAPAAPATPPASSSGSNRSGSNSSGSSNGGSNGNNCSSHGGTCPNGSGSGGSSDGGGQSS